MLFNDEQIKEIIKLYKEKLISAKEIAKQYNCLDITIKFLLLENNIELRTSYGKLLILSNEQNNEIIKLYSDKSVLVPDIVEQKEYSEKTILNVLKLKKVYDPSRRRSGVRISNEIKQKIRYLYFEENLTVIQIYKMFGMNENQATKLFKELEIETYQKQKYNFNKQKQNEIIDMYVNDKISAFTISKAYECGEGAIIRCLRKNKIEIRDHSHARQTCTVNENIFDIIDTDEKAYWLGFLYSDGCVSGGALSFGLAEQDKDMVYRFRNFMGSNHAITINIIKYIKKNGKNVISHSIEICNKHITKTVAQYGLIPNKTQKGTFPKTIPDQFMGSYFRGLNDGDGGFYLPNNGYDTLQLYTSYVGTEAFIIDFQKILAQKCNLNLTKLGHHKDTSYIRTCNYGGNNQLYRIVKFFYSSPGSYMYRKKARAISHFYGINNTNDPWANDPWLQQQMSSLQLLNDDGSPNEEKINNLTY